MHAKTQGKTEAKPGRSSSHERDKKLTQSQEAAAETAASQVRGGMRVAALVKQAILDGRYVPGQRLIESDLVRETGESRAHVREGLRHLRAEGLVEIEEYRGAVVKRITRNDIYLAGRVREALEGLAARQIAERPLTEEERETLTSLRTRLVEAVAAEDYAAYTAANEELHRFIIRASQNPYLDSFLERLRIVVRQTHHFAAYRSKAFFAGNVEHLAIIEAILHGHPDVAESMMRMHVRKGTLMIDEWLESTGATDP
ncbi:MAG TPA: GntR family transcriptional regulator [Steroidobacteraceae bacterium]